MTLSGELAADVAAASKPTFALNRLVGG